METLLSSLNLQLYPRSLVSFSGVDYGLVRSSKGSRLAVVAPVRSSVLSGFEGEISEIRDRNLLIGPLNARNAIAIRGQLPWLQPKILGLKTSAGMGDRLGIATPGHVRAVQVFEGRVTPIFAQQSIREMTRTGRKPQQVMDDATWGVFEEGWQGDFSADADHLKTTDDIDACIAAGFKLFTIDPGEYVDNNSEKYSLGQLYEKAGELPARLHPQSAGLLGKSFSFENLHLIMNETEILKASVKYGKAIAHVASMYEHLQRVANNRAFEVEISMDETDLPTSPAEHIYIANELQRLGVTWISFAPRFVGRFEKGVDYIGDLGVFEADLAIHAAIARGLGPYKLSLHSGSDKFSIYPIFMEKTQGLAHLKTAGTSYLEALRTIATLDKEFIREIYNFARKRFEADKHSYLLSAELIKAPMPDKVTDWLELINQFDAREILHVTYGSVLTERTKSGERLFYDRLMPILQTNRELYFRNLENHFQRHLRPFSKL
jgi:hypothetical protein